MCRPTVTIALCEIDAGAVDRIRFRQRLLKLQRDDVEEDDEQRRTMSPMVRSGWQDGRTFRQELRDYANAIAAEGACPYRKPKTADRARESVDTWIHERHLQVDLVRLDRTVAAAGCVGSRNPCSPTSAQCAAARILEASGPQQH
jgi:hypothetical protein